MFYKDEAAAKARHENGAKHKAAVAQALAYKRQAREKSEQEHEFALRDLESAKIKAQAKYAHDTAASARPEDAGASVGAQAKLHVDPPKPSVLFHTPASGDAPSVHAYADTAYGLGFGTNHPKYEAARTRTSNAARARVERSMNGEQLNATFRHVGSISPSRNETDNSNDGKRKRSESSNVSAKKKQLSQAEAEAQAKREAARQRVQERAASYMGMQTKQSRR